MSDDYSKAPRLYVTETLAPECDISLCGDHVHYLLNVLRKIDGTLVRVFNGQDGEFVGRIKSHTKKTASLLSLKKIRDQKNTGRDVHLYFAPIKKDRLSLLIEKSVELGVTHFHPVISDRTENRKFNPDKLEKQIIEAVEQCERLTCPILHNAVAVSQCRFTKPAYAAIERMDSPIFNGDIKNDSPIGIIIGPEGGWTENEIAEFIRNDAVIATSLGSNILRAETAAFFMLSRIVK